MQTYPETISLTAAEPFGKNGVYTKSFHVAAQSGCGQCMTVTALSRFEGDAQPTIRLLLLRGEKTIYASNLYELGRRGEPTRQQWRVPPMFHPSLRAEIAVEIPEGTKLYLTDLHSTYGDPERANDVGIRYNAHLGFKGLAPENTRTAVELAAQCGFSTCIITPKEIADGELICMHDPRVVKYASYPDGRPADDERSIYTMSLPEVSRWDYGLCRDEIFRGTGILRLEEFFEICAKTGMKPMFSAHEDAVRISGWRRISKMLRKYNLTRSLHVKSPCVDVLETAFDFFGDEIDGYTLDHLAPEQLKNSALGDAKCRLVIEGFATKLRSADEVKPALDMGFTFSAAAGPNTYEPYRRLIDWGVTEFTVNYHCSMGLNW